MASRTCNSCLRALQLHSRRTFQTSASRFNTSTAADKYRDLPELNQTTGAPVPPVSPHAGDKSKATTPTPRSLKVAQDFKKITGKSFTETYTAYGVTERHYIPCGAQADYSIPQATDSEAEMPKTDDGEDLGIGKGWWHEELGLKPTFSTWSQVTMLHVYLLSVRFRCFPTDSQTWQQHLLDHFFYDAENKMIVNHNMHARGTRNKYLKDMFIQWRGLLAAYDEGLAKGDTVLAAAIWRNIFKANEQVDIKGLATIVSYIRGTLSDLDKLTDEELMTTDLQFRSPKSESVFVAVKSRRLDLPFDKATGKNN